MIHFSSQVVNSRSFAYPASEKINSPIFSSACHLLFTAMSWDPSKGSMNGAQERTYLDFCSWVEQIKESKYGVNRTKNSSFFYCNMKTGVSLLFVAQYGLEDFGLELLSS